jgi:hypothetical protein
MGMMRSNGITSSNESEADWPRQPCGILIMGKRQGTKKENKQLWGRVALATALWYSAPQPKPYLIFVAADVHGPANTRDAQVVKSMLVEKFGIPADFIILRHKTYCTLLEVRAVRAISQAYGLANIFAVTHLYHAPRTQRYLDEVISQAWVIPVHLDILAEVSFPAEAADLLSELQTVIEDSLPGKFDVLREQVIEWLLSQAHTLDPRGRFERRLARMLRPRSYA